MVLLIDVVSRSGRNNHTDKCRCIPRWTPKLKKLLIDRGYTPKFIDLEFSRNYELDLALEQYDFVIIDVSPSGIPFWVQALLHGRFVPSIKLFHLPSSSADAHLPPLVKGQLLNTGSADSDTVLFWRDCDDVLQQINRQLDKFDTNRLEFHNVDDGNRYFLGLGLLKHRVFISNARKANSLASELSTALSARGIEHFHYISSNTIPLGSDWAFHLQKAVEDSDIFVALVSNDYEHSQYCTLGGCRITLYILRGSGYERGS